jgi:hypothetical protein
LKINVVVNPTPEQLAEIERHSAETMQTLRGICAMYYGEEKKKAAEAVQ